jgi:hypothetical protein
MHVTESFLFRLSGDKYLYLSKNSENVRRNE